MTKTLGRETWKIIRDGIKNRLGHLLIEGTSEADIKAAAKSVADNVRAEIETPFRDIIGAQDWRLTKQAADIKMLREAAWRVSRYALEAGHDEHEFKAGHKALSEALAATDPNRPFPEEDNDEKPDSQEPETE